MATIEEINEYLRAGASALAIIRGAIPLLPKGKDRDKAEINVEQAEKAIKSSEAALAKALGYHLCQCTFPPQIMLWNQAQQTNICPNCGNSKGGKPKINRGPQGGSWGQSRGGGPHGWMER